MKKSIKLIEDLYDLRFYYDNRIFYLGIITHWSSSAISRTPQYFPRVPVLFYSKRSLDAFLTKLGLGYWGERIVSWDHIIRSPDNTYNRISPRYANDHRVIPPIVGLLFNNIEEIKRFCLEYKHTISVNYSTNKYILNHDTISFYEVERDSSNKLYKVTRQSMFLLDFGLEQFKKSPVPIIINLHK